MKYGLIGEKLGHSFSKVIHERLLTNYEYKLQELQKDEVDAFMKAKAFDAINVTIPYKQTVIPYLDELDAAAKQIGAVNTIVNRNGVLTGYNTDYLGFKYTLDKHQIHIKNKKVLILGNGGASKAIQAVIHNEQPRSVVLVDLVLGEGITTLDDVYQNHLDCEVIINTTPVGMYPHVDASPVDVSLFKSCFACVDAVYNPLRTNFVLQAQSLGMKGISGLEMLVAQAKYALEFFKDIVIDESEIDRIYKELLIESSNVVIIGMPSSGKTTIGKQLSEALHKTFIDIDEEIVKFIQMTIPAFFKLEGEAAFREIESKICKEVSLKNNCIISCGGGIVKNVENIKNLKHNGIILGIHRDIDKLISDDTRPLSSSKAAIQALYDEREHLYRSSRELYVENNGLLEDATARAVALYKENIGLLNQ